MERSSNPVKHRVLPFHFQRNVDPFVDVVREFPLSILKIQGGFFVLELMRQNQYWIHIELVGDDVKPLGVYIVIFQQGTHKFFKIEFFLMGIYVNVLLGQERSQLDTINGGWKEQ